MSAQEKSYLWNLHYQLNVTVLTNLLYQQARMSVMDSRCKAVNLLTVASGGAIFAQLAQVPGLSLNLVFLSALVTLLGCVSALFDFSGKKCDANIRYRQWNTLWADIKKVGERDFTEDMIKSWSVQVAKISQDETAPNLALLRRCNARAAQCLGGTLERRYIPVPWPAMLRFIP